MGLVSPDGNEFLRKVPLLPPAAKEDSSGGKPPSANPLWTLRASPPVMYGGNDTMRPSFVIAHCTQPLRRLRARNFLKLVGLNYLMSALGNSARTIQNNTLKFKTLIEKKINYYKNITSIFKKITHG